MDANGHMGTHTLRGAPLVQVGRLVDDLLYGRDYIDPTDVKVWATAEPSRLCYMICNHLCYMVPLDSANWVLILQGGGITHDNVRQWRTLQELQVMLGHVMH